MATLELTRPDEAAGRTARRTAGIFSSFRGLSTIFLVLTFASLGTLFLPVTQTAWIQLCVAVMAVAVIGTVAVRRRPRPLWPTVLLVCGQALLAIQAGVIIASGHQPVLLTYILVGLASALQAVAWVRLAIGAGVGWNGAALLDTAVILIGLIGSAAILGAPKYMAIDDPSVTMVQNLASLVGVILIAAVAYGGLVRRPTPPSYQIVLTGLTFGVILRIVQAYFEARGTNIADAISQANVILVSLATVGAVVDPSYQGIGQDVRTRPRSWSVPRAFVLLGVSLMPVWAAAIALEDHPSAGLVVFLCLILEIALLLGRAVVAGRSEERLQERQTELLNRDPVTGLLTRRGLLYVADGTDRPEPLNGAASIVRIWLEDLEDLRETAGRPIAHRVERQWSQRLVNNLPASARVVRLSAGQYAVVLDGGRDPQSALRAVEGALAGSTAVIDLDGEQIQMRSTVAAAALPDLTDLDLDDALALAGIARRTQGTHAIGTTQMRERWADDTATAQEILADVAWRGLTLRVQPFIDPTASTVAGYEVLTSWSSPTKGRIRTDSFFAFAEGLTLTSSLDLEIVRRALAWEGPTGGAPGVLSINVNPATLLDGDVAMQILEAHHSRAWRQSTLWLEIIESDLREDSPRLAAILGLLASEGVRITVDDFGAGSSTLTRLADFHVSALKLDRALVDGISEDPSRRVIVKSMLTLAGDLGLSLVAEGIERIEDATVLYDMGCPLFQGFLWSAGTDLDAAPSIGTEIGPALEPAALI